MRRELWTNSLGAGHCPPWPCPVCKRGIARLRADSLIYEETAESKREHHEDYWGPEHIVFAFTAWADCSEDICKQSFAISGTGSVGQFIDDVRDTVEWYEEFVPHSIFPAPHIIEAPENCPATIRELLEQSFSLYWGDLEACASKLRSSLEALLTHIGVPDVNSAIREKQSRLPLYRRIEIFEKDSEQLGQHLMALKWLGNAGAHGKQIRRGDVLDAMELLEHALSELLERRSFRLSQLAARLTEKHGPKKLPSQ